MLSAVRSWIVKRERQGSHLNAMFSNFTGLMNHRPEQLLLQDDPSFLLNSTLPTFDLTILSQGSNMFDTQFTEASLHSKHSSQETVGDVLGGLVFPSDTTPGGLGGFDLARDYRYGTSQPGRSSVLARDDDGGLLLEDDIGIDEEGNIVELPPSEVHSAARSVRREIVRDGAASSRIRQEHEAFQATTVRMKSL
jgi:hypothetical protein